MAMFVNADKGAGEEKAPEVVPAGDGMFTIVASNSGTLHAGSSGGFSAQGTAADAVCVAAEGERLVVVSGGAAAYMGGVGAAASALPDNGGLGAFNSVSISDDGNTLWATTDENTVCVINGTGTGGAWEKVAGKACHIHVCGSGAHLVAVNPRGDPYFRAGYASRWEKLGQPGCGVAQATISDGKEVWAITSDNTVFVHNGDWQEVEGQAGTHVSVSSSGEHVAMVGTDGNIYYRAGLGGSWSALTSSGGYTTCSIAGISVDPAAIAAANSAFDAVAGAQANVASAKAAQATAQGESSSAADAAAAAAANAAAAKAAWEAAEAASASAAAEAESKAETAGSAAQGTTAAEAALASAIALALSTADTAKMGGDERYEAFR
jgi:hypothetical protein